jgi:hypothetical protein
MRHVADGNLKRDSQSDGVFMKPVNTLGIVSLSSIDVQRTDDET